MMMPKRQLSRIQDQSIGPTAHPWCIRPGNVQNATSIPGSIRFLQRYLGNEGVQEAGAYSVCSLPPGRATQTAQAPDLQLKGIDEKVAEDVTKGMLGSFEIFFDEDVGKKRGGLSGYIMFTPSKDQKAPDDNNIRLLQTAKVVDNENNTVFDVSQKYPQLQLPKAIETTEEKSKGIEAGFFVDKPYGELKAGAAFSKYYIDRQAGVQPGSRTYALPHKEGRYTDQHGLKKGAIVKPAILTDAPQWDREATFSFETYAQSDKITYGGIRWGFQIKIDPVLKSLNARVSSGVMDPVIAPQAVTPLFGLSPTAVEAVKRFEKAVKTMQERPVSSAPQNR